MEMPCTLAPPTASAAMAATSAESMPPDRPKRYALEAVLGHVVLESEHAGGVHLLVRVESRRDRGFLLMHPVRVERPVGEIPHEHGRTFEQRAVGVDDEAAAVEDEVVLAADLVHVDERRLHLGGAALRQFETNVGLALLVRGAVDRDERVDVASREFGDGTAILPDVLADGDAETRAVHVEHDGAFAGLEDAELVEHAVVRQEMLVVTGPYDAVV